MLEVLLAIITARSMTAATPVADVNTSAGLLHPTDVNYSLLNADLDLMGEDTDIYRGLR